MGMSTAMNGSGQAGSTGQGGNAAPWSGRTATGSIQRWFLAAALVLGAIAIIAAGLWPSGSPSSQQLSQRYVSRWKLAEIPFDGARAYEWLQKLCDLGSRASGTPGMAQQQKLLAEHFEKLGGKTEFQSFAVRHPQTGERVDMRNLWVHWHPERTDRILVCAHYDTRPLPDRDPDLNLRRTGVFLGANDGASSVALMCVLAEKLPQLEGPWGVDFVLFDGEELVYDDDRDSYFLGSTYFAQQWVAQLQPFHYQCAVLLDMVGDAQLQIYQERNSMSWPEVRPWVHSIWAKAKELDVREFIPSRKHELRDDHLPLHDIGRIPALDIIDFDFPAPGSKVNYWHTTQDRPDNCSALSLAKVGWVVEAWLHDAVRLGGIPPAEGK